jgi:hypothetical protein
MTTTQQVLAILAISFLVVVLAGNRWTQRLASIKDVDVAK